MTNGTKNDVNSMSGPVFEIVQTMGAEDQYGLGSGGLDEMSRQTLEIPPVVQEMHLAFEAKEASKLNETRGLQSRPTVEIPAPDRQALFEYLDRPYNNK